MPARLIKRPAAAFDRASSSSTNLPLVASADNVATSAEDNIHADTMSQKRMKYVHDSAKVFAKDVSTFVATKTPDFKTRILSLWEMTPKISQLHLLAKKMPSAPAIFKTPVEKFNASMLGRGYLSSKSALAEISGLSRWRQKERVETLSAICHHEGVSGRRVCEMWGKKGYGIKRSALSADGNTEDETPMAIPLCFTSETHCVAPSKMQRIHH